MCLSKRRPREPAAFAASAECVESVVRASVAAERRRRRGNLNFAQNQDDRGLRETEAEKPTTAREACVREGF